MDSGTDSGPATGPGLGRCGDDNPQQQRQMAQLTFNAAFDPLSTASASASTRSRYPFPLRPCFASPLSRGVVGTTTINRIRFPFVTCSSAIRRVTLHSSRTFNRPLALSHKIIIDLSPDSGPVYRGI